MPVRLFCRSLPTLLACAVVGGCQPAERSDDALPSSEPARGSTPGGVVEVIARDYVFEAPPEIPSGWNAFQMRNQGAEPHFLLLSRLPAGTTFQQYGEEVGAAFDTVMRELNAGAVDRGGAGEMLGRLLPEWFSSVEPRGGVGLVAPGRTGRTVVELEPGTYVMECYVKTPDGTFHSSLGMARPIVVTANSNGVSRPEADVEVRLGRDAIVGPAELSAGEHTVAVHYDAQPEAGLGNDVHLARLGEAKVDEVAAWMDWMSVSGLRSPPPAEFLGGAQELPAGRTSYFVVDAPAGRYAWISEGPGKEGMVREVTVR